MDYNWDKDIHPNLQQIIESNIIRVEADMNNRDIGILLYSLGYMDTPFDAGYIYNYICNIYMFIYIIYIKICQYK
jgi:hypothetical protein